MRRIVSLILIAGLALCSVGFQPTNVPNGLGVGQAIRPFVSGAGVTSNLDIYADSVSVTTINSDILSLDTATIASASITTLNTGFGVFGNLTATTINAQQIAGNINFNGGNVSGMGTLGCGAITSTGDLTLKGGANALIVKTSDDAYTAMLCDANDTRGQLLLYDSGVYKVKLTATAASEFLNGISATTGTFSDNILFSSTDKGIFANTVDTADSYKVSIGGGGTDSGIRGAFIRLHGNEDTPKGDLWLSAGRGDSSTDRGQVFIYNGFENLIATFGTAIGGVDTTFAGAVKVGAYTLPATDGTSGQVLVTNGSGVLTWTTL